jgi:FKBP-type peptidyl-prolyl cis-trans isomerase FklB
MATRTILSTLFVVSLLSAAALGEEAIAPLPKPESLDQRASYAFGVNLVSIAKQNAIELDPAYFSQGVRDALAGEGLLMTTDEIREALQEQQATAAAKHEAWKSAIGMKNKTEGDAFLAANKDREGVHVTASGLQYRVIKEGSGVVPKETDRVSVHYRGKLLGGPEFETSYGGSPIVVSISDVMPGWREALLLMPVGSHWKIWVPPDLAYGTEGKGGIGPNATLGFEIELLAVEAGGS